MLDFALRHIENPRTRELQILGVFHESLNLDDLEKLVKYSLTKMIFVNSDKLTLLKRFLQHGSIEQLDLLAKYDVIEEMDSTDGSLVFCVTYCALFELINCYGDTTKFIEKINWLLKFNNVDKPGDDTRVYGYKKSDICRAYSASISKVSDYNTKQKLFLAVKSFYKDNEPESKSDTWAKFAPSAEAFEKYVCRAGMARHEYARLAYGAQTNVATETFCKILPPKTEIVVVSDDTLITKDPFGMKHWVLKN